MEESRWPRFIAIGLIIAALAMGYFLLSGRFSSNKTAKTNVAQGSPSASVLGQNTKDISQSSPKPSASAKPATGSAYSRIADRNNQIVDTLPNTGFPYEVAVAFSISGMAIGWGLRKFPH